MMAGEGQMEADLKEIAALFQEAYRTLTTAKCRITAMAAFNRAQTMLDVLEKHPDPKVAGEIKKARAAVRAALGKEKSIYRIMETYAAYWQQAL